MIAIKFQEEKKWEFQNSKAAAFVLRSKLQR